MSSSVEATHADECGCGALQASISRQRPGVQRPGATHYMRRPVLNTTRCAHRPCSPTSIAASYLF